MKKISLLFILMAFAAIIDAQEKVTHLVSTMPKTATIATENDEYSIFINEEPTPESQEVKKVSLWVLNKKTQKSSRPKIRNYHPIHD